MATDKLVDFDHVTDYISREAALELIDNAPIIAGNENETLISAPELSDKVYCLPAADVVEVVRCNDCINWNGNDCITMHGLSAPRPDDYCSRGEREPDKEDWRTTLDRFKTRMKIFFDEAQSKEGG